MESKETLNKLIQTEGIESIKKMIDEISSVQQSAKDWLIDQLDGLTIDIKTDPNQIIYKKKDNNIYFWYDYKNYKLWVSYYIIWTVLQSKFGLNDKEISDLCRGTVGDTLKIRVDTTFPFLIRQ